MTCYAPGCCSDALLALVLERSRIAFIPAHEDVPAAPGRSLMRLHRLTFLAFVACAEADVRPAHAGWNIPETLVFSHAYVGYPAEALLPFMNEGLAEVRVVLAPSAPFVVDAAERVLAGGSTHPISVSFLPDATGEVRGSLAVRVGEVTRVVALVAQVEAPVSCVAADGCRPKEFDPSRGGCGERLLPDGTQCSSPCLDEAQCRAGRCVGTARACDDADACTSDFCDARDGCVHRPTTEHCPTPVDRCRAATCDPVRGCGEEDAPDGTVCGNVDCTTAHLCFLGSCLGLAVPEGAPCSEGSLCQDRGVCRNRRCELPPARELVPVREYIAPPDASLAFVGTMDAEGNLYWAEARAEGIRLVSADRNLQVRFRSPMPQQLTPGDVSPHRSQILVAGDFVAASIHWGGLSVHRRTDGALLWTNRGVDEQIEELAEDGTGRLLASVLRWEGRLDGPAPVALVRSYDIATGTALWTKSFEGYAGRLAVDEEGSVFTSIGPYASRGQAVSLTRDGDERWTRLLDGHDWVESVAGGRVFMKRIRFASDGRLQFSSGEGPWLSPDPMVHSAGRTSTTALFRVWAPWQLGLSTGDSPAFQRFSRIDWDANEFEWTASPGFGGGAASGLLADDGSVLLARVDHRPASTSPRSVFHRIDSAGTVTEACPLAADVENYLAGFTALHSGRWFIASLRVDERTHAWVDWRIRAFDVGSQDAAAQGWVSRAGTLSGGRRAR